MHNLIDLIDKFQGRPVMVIGDMVADVYLDGRIARISREAPVLVLEYAGEKMVPGGAANVVHNTATLGGAVHAVGVLGDDTAGDQLTRLLAAKGVDTSGLVVDPARCTTTKTRVLAGGQATVRQQVVRIDRECKDPLATATEERLISYIREKLPSMQGVIISDYGSGVVTPRIAATAIAMCRQAGIPCMVDSRYNILAFTGVTAVKQNEAEAAAALGCGELADDNAIAAAGRQLLSRLDATAVLITRGPAGMTLVARDGAVSHIPVTNKSEVYDVTGAGDTVVVTFVLALTAGASYEEAARLANFAAGVVVRKMGTATADATELKQAVEEWS